MDMEQCFDNCFLYVHFFLFYISDTGCQFCLAEQVKVYWQTSIPWHEEKEYGHVYSIYLSFLHYVTCKQNTVNVIWNMYVWLVMIIEWINLACSGSHDERMLRSCEEIWQFHWESTLISFESALISKPCAFSNCANCRQYIWSLFCTHVPKQKKFA